LPKTRERTAQTSIFMNLLTVVEDFLRKPARCGNTRLIAIDGPAGAGKTTLANALSLALETHRSVNLIHLDEIYAGWELALTQLLTISLSKILKSVSAGDSAIIPIYDWSTQQFASTREISPCEVLIFEGVGSAQRVVRELASMTIWLDIDPCTGLERVLQRDGTSITDQMHLWQIREEAHFIADATRENVDFILSTI
jgi:uridine kinase